MATCNKCGSVLPDDGKIRKRTKVRQCNPCRLLERRRKRAALATDIPGIMARLRNTLLRHSQSTAFVTTEFVERVLQRWGRSCVITGQTMVNSRIDLIPYRGFGNGVPPEHEWIVVASAQKKRLGAARLNRENRMALIPEQVHTAIADHANPQ